MSYDLLWAPWRLEYLSAHKEGEPTAPKTTPAEPPQPFCFLCQARDSTDDRSSWVVARFPQTMVVLNRYPYNNGHLLVCTLRHEGQLAGLTPDERGELTEVVTIMIEVLREVLRPDGFNVGLNLGTAAGAGVPGHIHWHIVPRWCGDTNFMPVVAQTKVIPQSLEALWTLLRGHIIAVRARFGL